MAWEGDPWYSAAHTEIETQQISVLGIDMPWYHREDRIGPQGEFRDDADAFLYYSAFGLNPVSMVQNLTVDARIVMAMTGLAFGPAAFVAIVGGMVAAGAVGWAVDPMHKREGGMDDWNWGAISDVVYYEWR